MSDKVKIRVLAILTILLIVIVLVIVIQPDEATIEVDVEGKKIKFDAKKDLKDHGAMLTKIFETDFSNSAAKVWLNKYQKMFSLSDNDEFTANLQELCDDHADDRCLGNPNVKRLRNLSDNNQPPFHHVFDEVKVGVQDEKRHRPSNGHANACANGPYENKYIVLLNPKKEKIKDAKFYVSGRYRCVKGGSKTYPDLQLNKDDAVRLFERVINTTVEAEAAILHSL